MIAGDWAEGFLDAMGLRPEAWTEMLDDENDGLPLVPILALTGSENQSTDPADGPDELEDLGAAASELIPSCIVKIDAFWKARRRPDAITITEPKGRKPGRNEPCPCGSGRKYKRCCGAI